jgi:glycosyltransferase involved in cell wall biosynthesis
LLSVIIICKEEEDQIKECLESVKWADEIILVDAESKDKTVDIAKSYTDKIYIKKWEGYSVQRNYALSLANYKWVLSIDADERVTGELKEEIISVINSGSDEIKGFRIPRKTYFLNRWIKHSGWYPGYQMRLFQKEFVYMKNRLVHEGFEVKGETGYLKNNLLHYTVTSISDFAERVNTYSTLQAEEKSITRKVRYNDLFFRPFVSFFKYYILKCGFRDGPQGFMVAMFDLITNSLTYMKIWEMQNKKEKSG